MLWVTSKADVFQDLVDLPNGTPATGLVQTYLDLHLRGDRGQEAAEFLMSQKLAPKWNEDAR